MALLSYHQICWHGKILRHKNHHKHASPQASKLSSPRTYWSCCAECQRKNDPFRITYHLYARRFLHACLHRYRLKHSIKKVDTIIIEEVSMVSAELMDFISNLFSRIYGN